MGHSLNEENRAAAATVRNFCRSRAPQSLFATYFLESRKRDAFRALVAFLSIAHEALAPKDAAGDCCSGGSNLDALVRQQIERIYEGTLELPLPQFRDESQHILHAFRRAVQQFEIPKEHLINWIDSVIADQRTTRYATWSALEHFCHHSAGSLTLAAMSVLGVTRSDAVPLILNFATGVRLSKILIRVNEDRLTNRIYLPLADLAHHRYSERELLAGVMNDNLKSLIAAEVERARVLLKDGEALIPWLAGDGSRVAASAVIVQRYDLLDAIARRGFDVFAQPPLEIRFSLRRLPAIWKVARQPHTPISATSSPSSA